MKDSQAMDIIFSEIDLEKVEAIKSRYPEQQAALMPVLWLAQRQFGWLSKEVMMYVAGLLGLSYAHVYGVATFYTMYFKKPMGKNHIQVCTNVSCMLGEGEMIFQHVAEKLGISNNETTADGMFSLEEVECMGACGGAPMIAINEDYFENVSVPQVDSLIDSLQ